MVYEEEEEGYSVNSSIKTATIILVSKVLVLYGQWWKMEDKGRRKVTYNEQKRML